MRIGNLFEININPAMGIFLMMFVTVVLAGIIGLLLFGSHPDNVGPSIHGIVIDTVYLIQYNQDDVYIRLTGDKDIKYRVLKSEERLISILEDSYNNRVPVKISYEYYSWQINNIYDVEYSKLSGII